MISKKRPYGLMSAVACLMSTGCLVACAGDATLQADAPVANDDALATATSQLSGAETFIVASQKWVANGLIDATTATCPSGSLVTGGGYGTGTGASFNMPVTESMVNGNGWATAGSNTSGAPQLISAYAICLRGVAAKTIAVWGNILAVKTWENNCVSATCPANTIAIGGGFYQSRGTGNTYVSAGTTNARVWKVCNYNDQSEPVNIYPIAVCLQQPTATVRQTSAYVEPPSLGIRDVAAGPCAADEVLTSDGFEFSPDLQQLYAWPDTTLKLSHSTFYNPNSTPRSAHAKGRCVKF